MHETLFPMGWQEIVTTVLCVIGCTLAVAGGIGGGGLFVPLFLIILRLEPETAVALSKAMIFGASVVSFAFNCRKVVDGKHVINVSAALMLEPLCLSGTIIGVNLNVLLPGWLVVMLLCIVLSITTYRTIVNAIKIYRFQSKASAAAAEVENRPGGKSYQSLDMSYYSNLSPELQEILQKEAEFDWRRALLLITLWAVLVGTSIGRRYVGGCNWAFWLLMATPIVLSLLLTAGVGWKLRQEHELKVRESYQFSDADLIWDKKSTIAYPLVCLLAGILAGMLGIGGGMVIGPLMLEMARRPDPVRTSAVSSFMVLFTSSATTTQFIALGALKWDYAGWFCSWAILAALLGSTAVAYAINRFGKKAYIVFALAAVIMIATVLTGIEFVLKLIELIENTDRNSIFEVDFHRICKGAA